MINKKIFHNGIILSMTTSNLANSIIEAVGIVDEKIEATGSLKEVQNQMGENTELIDLKGACMLPGFSDCHIHPVGSLFYFIFPDLAEVKSIDELKTVLKKSAQQKKPDELILGLNFNEQNFNPPVLPTRWDLDEAVMDNPCGILRTDGHLIVINSKALKAFGINENTPVPEGGEIQKNKEGKITGILTENATNLVMNSIPPPDSETTNAAALKFSQSLAEKGITSVHGLIELDHEGGVENLGGISIPIMKLVKDKIFQNYYFMVYTQTPKKLNRLRKSALHDKEEEGKYKVGALKSWFDGTYGSASALMYENFTDLPEKNGFLVVDKNVLYERMVEAHNLGYQIAIHSIGDKANRMLVDMYKKLLKDYPREDHRHRIEHCSSLMDDVIKDMKELGIIASCQPSFLNSEYKWLERRIGKERSKQAYPYKSLISEGVIVAAGSDCPVEDPDPIKGLHALVTRNGFVPEQCIPIEEALKFYTINAAFACFQEKVRGTIELGKMADFVILDRNPLTTPPNEVKNIQILSTIIKGEVVFQRDKK